MPPAFDDDVVKAGLMRYLIAVLAIEVASIKLVGLSKGSSEARMCGGLRTMPKVNLKLERKRGVRRVTTWMPSFKPVSKVF